MRTLRQRRMQRLLPGRAHDSRQQRVQERGKAPAECERHPTPHRQHDKDCLLRGVRLDLVAALSSSGRARRRHEEGRFLLRCDFTTCLMKLATSNATEHGRRLQNPTGRTGKTATWAHVHNTQTSDLRSCGRTDACIWGRMSWAASLPNTCLPGGSQSCPRLELYARRRSS